MGRRIYEDVPNWWYHYVAQGNDAVLSEITPQCLTVSNRERKLTPRFDEYVYDSCICHSQIGESLVPRKSIVVVKTTVGVRDPPAGCIEKVPLIVGHFRVEDIVDGKVYMDSKDSSLLLDSPIPIDTDLAPVLFPKLEGKKLNGDLVRLVGSMTRNAMVLPEALEYILDDIDDRSRRGATNYMGKPYAALVPPSIRQTWQGDLAIITVQRSMLQYLRENPGSEFTLDELCSQIGLGRECLGRPAINTLVERRVVKRRRSGRQYVYYVEKGAS